MMYPKVSSKRLQFAACSVFLLAASCSAPDGGQISPANGMASSSASTAQVTVAPSIIDYGPRDVSAGKVFNVQPDGQAAIWVRMSASIEGTDATIHLGNTELKSAISGRLITAFVPPDVYAKPGALPLAVVQHSNGKKLVSGPVVITVR